MIRTVAKFAFNPLSMLKEMRIVLILALSLITFGCSSNTQSNTLVTTGELFQASGLKKSDESSLCATDPAAAESNPEQPSEDDEEWADEFDEIDDEFATKPGEEVIDPFEGYNRFMTDMNDTLIVYVLDPVSRGYRYVVPEGVRRSINRFFHNLLYPIRLVNNILQAKFQQSAVETARFVINTTIGLLGFFDPAKEWFGLEPYEEDFGQTLGFWGVGAGPHFVLPILGPSNLRDTFSLYPDWQLDPISLVDPLEKELGVRAYKAVNEYSLHIGEYESIKKDAVDLYLFLRDAYEQNRKKKIEE